MSDEPVRTRVHGARRAGALPGVHDPRARPRARSRTSSFDGRRTRPHPTPEVLDGDRAAPGDRRSARPTRSISIGPILARARDARGAARRAARRSSPSARSSAARCSRARPRRSWTGRGLRAERRGRRRASTAACSTGWSPTSRADRAARLLADRHAAWPTPTRAARGARDARRSPRRSRGSLSSAPMRTVAILPVKRFDARQAAAGASVRPRRARRALARAMVADVLTRCAACAALDDVVVVTARAAAPRRSRAARRRPVDRRPRRGGPERGRRARHRARASSAAPSACCSSPATARRSTPRELDALLRTRRGAEVVIVPDRHGTGTNGLLLAPPDAIAPSFGPGSRARHRALARDGRRRAARSTRVASLRSTSTRPTTSPRCAARWRARRGGAAHTRGARCEPAAAPPAAA